MKRSPKITRSEPALNLLDRLSDRRLSVFKTARDPKPNGTMTLGEFFDAIANKPLPVQEKIRAGRKQLKESSLSAVMLSGTVRERRANDNLAEHSGLIQVDCDH